MSVIDPLVTSILENSTLLLSKCHIVFY